ncbi:hypothetical protein PVAND_002231 [Polypedilum vanderplanki]|uniref:Uncharacterized protein n=1 Tax=Polypedilum vanderplanki TaxID=319348 RepID=A0A9J6BQT5_POLVA|nr:hypothetical protein PVAND_002231 [Polypedilum vanderplanki]
MTIEECNFINDTINFRAKINKPVVKLEVSATVYQFKDGIAKQIFDFPKIEWCTLLRKGQINKILFVKIFIKLYGKYLGVLFQCPIAAEIIAIENVKLPQINLVPSGIYRGKVLAKGWSAVKEESSVNVTGIIQLEGIF